MGKKQDSVSKINRSKRAGGMTQAVKLSKPKALSSNPNTEKKNLHMYI
jgi:hypothetical protein